ncbi:MAG: hypothetical protein ACKO4A_00475 [Gammaproteobacteria bacterium]
MRITASAIALGSERSASTLSRTEVRLRADPVAPEPVPRAPAATTPAAAGAGPGLDPQMKEQDILLLALLVEYLTGREVRIARLDLAAPEGIDTAASPAEAPMMLPASSIESVSVSLREEERTRFRAAGEVQTADGRRIAFALDLRMERSLSLEASASRAPVQQKDPLVINLRGGAAALGERAYRFDLDADGEAERIAFVTGGSAFLAIDRDGNGRIGDGRELFGALTGDGFAELARYDSDGNGFIDEGDPVFSRLLAWSRAADGSERLEPVASLGVGAIYLGAVDTRFALEGAGAAPLGTIRQTGVFLREDGSTGTLQQVDLVV